MKSENELPKPLQEEAAKKDIADRRLDKLSVVDESKQLKVIVETPRNSRNKYKYDPETGLFECHKA